MIRIQAQNKKDRGQEKTAFLLAGVEQKKNSRKEEEQTDIGFECRAGDNQVPRGNRQSSQLLIKEITPALGWSWNIFLVIKYTMRMVRVPRRADGKRTAWAFKPKRIREGTVK